MKSNKWIQQISKIFASESNRYKAHELARPVMSEMVKDRNFLKEIIRSNFSNPQYLLKKRHYSTMAMEVVHTKDYHMVVNIFPALPDGRLDISFQNIHHHGNLLLTTIAAFGPGYTSIIFDKDFAIDKATDEVAMKMNRFYHNPIGNIEFVDVNVPHIVFYPKAVSATIALWSNASKKPTDKLKQVGIVKKFKVPLSKMIDALGLKKTLGVNYKEFCDFYTENGKLYPLRDRIHYPEGSNENFVRNILSFAQQVGFDDMDLMKKIAERNDLSAAAKNWVTKFINRETISEEFEPVHLNLKKVNLSKAEIESATGSNSHT